MTDVLRRAFSKAMVAWVLALGLLVLLVLQMGGWIDLHALMLRKAGILAQSYSAASQQLAAADRSQPLHLMLEGQFPGPLQDTTIERWRDPVDGTVCYVYLPIAVAHSSGPSGLVQYGAANIGSISCIPKGAARTR